MLSDDLLGHGQHVMTVCNSCRYCEAYCPVFPAIESRFTFSKVDLAYFANLCHNCGECLYACQYAPPHEFGINVPRTLAQIRARSYEDYCWPRFLAVGFARHWLLTTMTAALGFIGVFFAARQGVWWRERSVAAGSADFYQVIPHHVMVTLFGAVSILVTIALVISCRRFWRDMNGQDRTGSNVASGFSRKFNDRGPLPPEGGSHTRNIHMLLSPVMLAGFRDALTLKHLHVSDVDCVDDEEARRPWRRWLHHLTFYGFGLCFASTSVAALYHVVFSWRAPYGYASLPVIFGTIGGFALLIGPCGLLVLDRTRDEALDEPARTGLDTSFASVLAITSATGLLLLLLRESTWMPLLLMVHLAFVLALFLALPYGKFVHGIYRTAALIKFSHDAASEHDRSLA
jgi:citrate/tricarballylate utilization protein